MRVISQDELFMLRRLWQNTEHSELCQMFDIPSTRILNLKGQFIKEAQELARLEKDYLEKSKRAIGAGCYFENGYLAENLEGWERQTLLKGPKYKL